MAEENVVTETIEASGNNEAIIKTIEEKNEQETQQLAKETTEDTVPQSSAVEGDHSEAADEKAKTDALVEHGDGGDKNEVGSSTKVATEPNASIDATDDEEATRGEEPQISPGEDKEAVSDAQEPSPPGGEPLDELQQVTSSTEQVPKTAQDEQDLNVDQDQDLQVVQDQDLLVGQDQEAQPKNEADGSTQEETALLEKIREEDEAVEENEEDEEPEESVFDRDEAIDIYRELMADQEKLQTAHMHLQHKIAEYLARKKMEERVEPGRTVTDQEQRYRKCMKSLEQLQIEASVLRDDYEREKQELKELCQLKDEQVQQAREEFADFICEKAVTAIHSRTGRRLTEQEVGQYLNQMEKKDQEVTQVRLKNIKLMNRIQKLELLIKQKEQLAEGLHMIDFEQLKMSNVDLTEKIEERNEDILKLKGKVDSTIQILAHLKEKLQFVQAENSDKEEKLREIDEIVAKKRNVLTRLKQARDAVRSDNLRLRQKGGLVSHQKLLRDFEEKIDESDVIRQQLVTLQQRHSELLLQCSGLRERIDQARAMNVPT